MSEARVLDTGVVGALAHVQVRPDYWSFSALKTVETCPRRYVLSRASYPDLWDGWGYPQVPSLAALYGDVVHDALEVAVKALSRAGCETLRSQPSVQVLKSLGGYTSLVEGAIDRRLSRLAGNPRLSDKQRLRIHQWLTDRIADARGQVQEYLSRTLLPSFAESSGGSTAGSSSRIGHGSGTGTTVHGSRGPALPGLHPEAVLQSDELRLKGKVDLLRVGQQSADIVDYKTGQEDPSHLDQLRMYAVLWCVDVEANPDGRPAGTLTAAYPARDVTVEAPDIDSVDGIVIELSDRIAKADLAIKEEPTQANPSEENCSTCPVRGLCAEYWTAVAPDPNDVEHGEWFDYAGIVLSRNGLRSWWIQPEGRGEQPLLLRTNSESQVFDKGTRLRLIGIRKEDDSESPAPVAAMSVNTDVLYLK